MDNPMWQKTRTVLRADRPVRLSAAAGAPHGQRSIRPGQRAPDNGHKPAVQTPPKLSDAWADLFRVVHLRSSRSWPPRLGLHGELSKMAWT